MNNEENHSTECKNILLDKAGARIGGTSARRVVGRNQYWASGASLTFIRSLRALLAGGVIRRHWRVFKSLCTLAGKDVLLLSDFLVWILGHYWEKLVHIALLIAIVWLELYVHVHSSIAFIQALIPH